MAKIASTSPVVTYSAEAMPRMALKDLREGLLRPELWMTFALFDIRQRFKRSMLGPLWLTLSMAIMIGALTLVFSTIFEQPVEVLIPYLTAGLITWFLMFGIITDAGQTFSSAEGFIRNVPMPLSVHFFRMLMRNLIIWTFNIVVFLLVWLVFERTFKVEMLLFFPGFLLLLANLGWLGLSIAVLSTRYRDIPQVVAAGLQVMFFLTPVFWTVAILPKRPAFVTLNPLFHLLEIVRAPLLGTAPAALSWAVSIGLLIVGAGIAWYLFRRSFPRLAYWV